VTGGWRKMHSEELHHFYYSPDIISKIMLRRVRGMRHVVCMGEMRNAHKILVRKHEGKWPLKRHRRDWRIILNRAGMCVDWIHLALLSD
jgi:hypothetical protein